MSSQISPTSNSDFLHLIQFSKIDTWSAYSLLGNQILFKTDFEFVPLKVFLSRNKTAVILSDKTIYTRVKVKLYGNGVVVRDAVAGKEIKTKTQWLLRKEQFIFSRIDARNGAFGIATKEVDNAIVTNDFPVYDIDINKINPDFLYLITSSKHFQEHCQKLSSGTTGRQRIDENAFLNISIPLPNTTIQKSLVDAYNSSISRSNVMKQQSILFFKKVKDTYEIELGIKQNKFTKRLNGKLFYINFKELEKWGLDFIMERSSITHKYPLMKIKELCKISSGGTPARSNKNYYKNGIIPWIKSGELIDEVLNNTEEKITQDALENSSAKIYSAGSLAIAMYGATIGKTAKLGIDATTNQAIAVLFEIKHNLVDTDFLWLCLQNESETFKTKAYGSAQPNINAQIIGESLIPIPSIEIQKSIVQKLNIIKDQAKKLQSDSKDLRINAKDIFEAQLFKN